jgi:hypothetical protein
LDITMSLIESIDREIERCKELLEAAKYDGPYRTFAYMLLAVDIAAAREAMAHEDTPGMNRALATLEAIHG